MSRRPYDPSVRTPEQREAEHREMTATIAHLMPGYVRPAWDGEKPCERCGRTAHFSYEDRAWLCFRHYES